MSWRCGDCEHYKYDEDYTEGKCDKTNKEKSCCSPICENFSFEII